MECLQAALRTPSSPDHSRLIPFALDCTRLSPTGDCSQAIVSCPQISIQECFQMILFLIHVLSLNFKGNHTIAIVKGSKDYKTLKNGLKNVCKTVN